MKSRLPNHLNPQRFKKELGVYSDDYENRYSLSYSGQDFFIENKTPFKIFLAAGINGKDLEDRKQIVEILQIAERIHFDTGKWPTLSTEWGYMCPGACIELDVTPLTLIDDPWLRLPLPDVLQGLTARLKSSLRRSDGSFGKAEKQYQSELKGVEAFNETMRAMQRDFDAKPLCTVNANTKARRLRYVVSLAHLAETPINTRLLSSRMLKWAEERRASLDVHEDPKGAILSSTGPRSVVAYIELASQLSILVSVGRKITLTNSGRALVLFQSDKDQFALSASERLHFLFELLSHDRDLICPLILEISEVRDRKSELRKIFPEAYKNYLMRLRDLAGTIRSKRQIDAALERVIKWRKAEIYMEHIVDPRISWLVDLKLCRLESDKVFLTERGTTFAKWLRQYADAEVFVITESFLRSQFFGTIAHLVDDDHQCRREHATDEMLIGLLGSYCEFVRQHTSSLAPNRIVASTLFRYAGIKLWVEHGIAADFMKLVEVFSDEKRVSRIGWRLRWLAAQDDGYLTPLRKRPI
jgi:hypothetical protein